MKFFPSFRYKSLWKGLILGALIVFPTLLHAQSFPREQIEEAMEQNQLDRADSYIRSVLSDNPRHERALGYMIELMEKRGNQQETYRYYRRLADRPPDNFQVYPPEDVYYHAGILSYQQGEYDRAIRYINRAQRQLEPSDETRYERMEGWKLRARAAQDRLRGQERQQQRQRIALTLGEILSEREWDRAGRFLKEQRDSFVDDEFFRPLEQLHEYFVAIRDWHRFTREIPGSAGPSTLEEKIQFGQEHMDREELNNVLENVPAETRQVLRSLHQSLSGEWIRPGLIRLSKALGTTYYHQQAYQQALDPLLRAHSLSGSPEAETLEYLARAHYQLGQYEEARRYFYEWEQSDLETSANRGLDWKIWLFHRGPLLISFLAVVAGIFIGGWFLIRRYSVDALTALGVYLGDRFRDQGWTTSAFWTYRIFCEPSGMPESSLNRYISTARQLGQRERREELLEQGYQSDRLTPDMIVEWGRVLLGRDDPRAREVLESALPRWVRLSPRAKESLARGLSQEYLEDGDPERAYKLLLKLLEEKGNDSRLYRRVTRLASSLGDWDEWRTQANQWFRFVSDAFVQSSHRRTIGETEDEKKLADPVQVASELLEQYQKNRDCELGEETTDRLKQLLEWIREADTKPIPQRDVLEQLVQRELPADKRKQFGLELAEVYLSAEDRKAAVSLLESLLESFPDDLEILTMLSNQYVENDQRESAYRLLVRILEIQTDNVSARKQLERLGRRYEDEEDYESAERFYRAVLEHSSFQQPELQLRLGTALYKQDQIEEALAVFQKITQGEAAFQAKIISFIARCLVELEMYDVAAERVSEVDLQDGAIPSATRRSLHYWKARAWEGAGKNDRALESYRQIMGSDVDFRDVAERVSRLQSISRGSTEEEPS